MTAAKAVDGFLASFSTGSGGAPDADYFSSSFTSDGMSGQEFAGLCFRGAEQVELIPRGVRLCWSGEEVGANWQEILACTRGELVDGKEESKPVWVELMFQHESSETFQGETYSYQGSGLHYLGLLEGGARSGAMEIVRAGPYRELERLIQPQVSASHYFVAQRILIGATQVYAAGAFDVYQLPVAAGTSLSIFVPVEAAPSPPGQDDGIELHIAAMLFDDESPALARCQDAGEGPLGLYRQENGLPPDGSHFSLSGELWLPADLPPGSYTLSVTVETLDGDGNSVARELIVLALQR